MPAPALTPATVLVQAPEIIEVRVGGALVLYEPDGDRYVRLNPTAAELWRSLAAPVALHVLARGLAEAYGIEVSTAEGDTRAVLGRLIAREMVAILGA